MASRKVLTTPNQKRGRANRAKGAREETRVLGRFIEAGMDGRKTAASGAMEGYEGDLEVKTPVGELDVEIKLSKTDSGMGIIRRYLEPVDLVFARQQRGEAMVFMREDLFFKLCRAGLGEDVNKLFPCTEGVSECTHPGGSGESSK